MGNLITRVWKWAQDRARGHVKWGVIIGFVLAVICHYVPDNYKFLCDAAAACVP